FMALTCLLSGIVVGPPNQNPSSHPSYTPDVARAHEVKPYRHIIPLEGVPPGFHQIRLSFLVTPAGDVLRVAVGGDKKLLEFQSQLEKELSQWKFTPFEENGKAVLTYVEELIELVPAERLPKKHVTAPVLRPDSKIMITLQRTGLGEGALRQRPSTLISNCPGSCPSYTVTVSTDGIAFIGRDSVAASGKHTATVKADDVRTLAKKFVAADFYSMEASYRLSVTNQQAYLFLDQPTYVLSIAIDGHEKTVEDYLGFRAGIPAVITGLEGEVDTLAGTQRWTEGGDGLVAALQAEHFNLQSFEAQIMLKGAASRGQRVTVREFLKAGVPLGFLPAPKPETPSTAVPFAGVGWLNAASNQAGPLQVFMDAGVSKDDQTDKDLALAAAAQSGNLATLRALIAYGADPQADLNKLVAVPGSPGAMTIEGPDGGSILIQAAESGNPEIVREILRYHPNLEIRNRGRKTALFTAGEYRVGDNRDKNGARAECVRLLVQSGADVNARDYRGNTLLHYAYFPDVAEELLKAGADVNARNINGETPMFTVINEGIIPLLVKHGANFSIRNYHGETVMEFTEKYWPSRLEVLRKARQTLQDR
ncbi:MAG TPA: ankyrin repeat domain-containing protein, partial [Candidatus Angelobacter sp.]